MENDIEDLFNDWDDIEYEERYILVGDIISFTYVLCGNNNCHHECRVVSMYYSDYWRCNLYSIMVDNSDYPHLFIGKKIRDLVFKE